MSLRSVFAGAPERLSIEELAKILGLTPNTVRRWLEEGTIPGYQVPIAGGKKGTWLVFRDEVIEALEKFSNQKKQQ